MRFKSERLFSQKRTKKQCQNPMAEICTKTYRKSKRQGLKFEIALIFTSFNSSRVSSLQQTMGTLRKYDGDTNKTAYGVIIPIRSTCTVWPNYLVTEQMGSAFKLRQRIKIHHHVFTFSTPNKCSKMYNTRAGPLFSYAKLFCDVLVPVAVVASP